MISNIERTPVRQKAKQLAKSLRSEYPNYDYLRELFRHLRKELNVEVNHKDKKLPYVPTEKEIDKYYKVVWQSRNMKHVVIIKTLLYTGVRVRTPSQSEGLDGYEQPKGLPLLIKILLIRQSLNYQVALDS
ncbi:hypothetical protein [Rickettsia endosymbiont of Oedothorax gibbosus]|uniref:hypothetical protein n=1 Tax=Rickettsia endosymbiont of Oedothorax gibbosus TaxID=931099 RepID=UPI0020258234|nr:hypothetical protein [Rickettsia endosymbiont of Oedothorax gibbosus]